MMRNIIRIKGSNDEASSNLTRMKEMELTTESIISELEDSCRCNVKEAPVAASAVVEPKQPQRRHSASSSSHNSTNSSTGSSSNSSREYFDSDTPEIYMQQQQKQNTKGSSNNKSSTNSHTANSSAGAGAKGGFGLLTAISQKNQPSSQQSTLVASTTNYGNDDLVLQYDTSHHHHANDDDQTLAAMECLVMSMNEIKDELRDKSMECTVLHETILTISRCLQQCEQKNEVLSLRNEQLMMSLQSLTFKEFVLPPLSTIAAATNHYHPLDKYHDTDATSLPSQSTTISDPFMDEVMDNSNHHSSHIGPSMIHPKEEHHVVSKRTSSLLTSTTTTTTTTTTTLNSTAISTTNAAKSDLTRPTSKQLPPTPETFRRLFPSSSSSATSSTSQSPAQEVPSDRSPVCVDDGIEDDNIDNEVEEGVTTNIDRIKRATTVMSIRSTPVCVDDLNDEEKKDDDDDHDEGSKVQQLDKIMPSSSEKQPAIFIGPSQAHFYNIIKERDVLQQENRVYKRKVQSLQNQLSTTKQQLHHCYNLLELLYNPTNSNSHNNNNNSYGKSMSSSSMSSKARLGTMMINKRRGSGIENTTSNNGINSSNAITNSSNKRTNQIMNHPLISDHYTDSSSSSTSNTNLNDTKATSALQDDSIYSDLFLPQEEQQQQEVKRSKSKASGAIIVDAYMDNKTSDSDAVHRRHENSKDAIEVSSESDSTIKVTNDNPQVYVPPPQQRRCQEYALEVDQYPWRRKYSSNSIKNSTAGHHRSSSTSSILSSKFGTYVKLSDDNVEEQAKDQAHFPQDYDSRKSIAVLDDVDNSNHNNPKNINSVDDTQTQKKEACTKKDADTTTVTNLEVIAASSSSKPSTTFHI